MLIFMTVEKRNYLRVNTLYSEIINLYLNKIL